jgi:hypothetical protein
LGEEDPKRPPVVGAEVVVVLANKPVDPGAGDPNAGVVVDPNPDALVYLHHPQEFLDLVP